MTLQLVFNPLSGQFDQVQDLENIDALGFSTSYVTTESEPVASVFWDADNHCFTMVLENGARLQVGQEGVFWGVNKTGVTIPNGTPVYISGVQGNRPTIAPCKGDSDATAFCAGVTTQEFLDNAEGYVTFDGMVRDMTTLAGFADGDGIWISKTTDGAIVNAEPAKPHHSDKIGVVLSNHATQGVLLVKIARHLSVHELSNVGSTAPTTTGALLVWNQSTSIYDAGLYNILDLPYIRTTPSTAAQNTIQPSADIVGLTVKQPVGGTANLLNLLTSAGVIAAQFNKDGDLKLGNTGHYGQLVLSGDTALFGDVKIYNDTYGGAFLIETNATAKFRMLPFGNDIYFQNTVVPRTGGIYFTGYAGQNTDGTVGFYLGSTGKVTFGPSGSSSIAMASFIASADRVHVGIQAHSSQTANNFELKSSSSALLMYIDKAGCVKSSGRRLATATKTADYTLTANDEFVVCNGTGLTMTLPAATGSGQTYTIKNINASAVTVDANSSDTIDGQLTQSVSQWSAIKLHDYATGAWAII